MSKTLAIALLDLRRMFRDRTNIFFMLLLPLIMVFMMGLSYGEDQQRLGVVVDGQDRPLAERLATSLEEGGRFSVERVDTSEELRRLVERGQMNAGLVIPDDYDRTLRDGDTAEIHFLSRPDDWSAYPLSTWARSVATQEASVLGAAQFAAEAGGDGFDESLRRAEEADPPGIEIVTVTAGEAIFPQDVSQYGLAAPPLLLLFTFVISLTTAIGVVELRQKGLTRRMYSTPTSVRSLVAGESLGRFVITLVQALVILVGSSVLFGVSWGDPLGVAAVVTTFCLVGSGAAMLIGSLCRSEGGAMAAALAVGMGAAGAGGTMVPLEALQGPSRTAAYATPHAWGYEAFSELIRHGGGIGDILPQLSVLLGYAIVLFALGAWRMRVVITR
ncbi:ABC transporter permease [Nocardiopsis sp. ATB16-24]|uniref:ABC transporter permease n=1 Tax=Nocardiopsis sp. ATB16-24 TaxID=3019555 RepID=UPI0025553D63|nr:ABC transporter permease [Nocardiopsis sp. ATB16-24]